jgi:hypothetical protein
MRLIFPDSKKTVKLKTTNSKNEESNKKIFFDEQGLQRLIVTNKHCLSNHITSTKEPKKRLGNWLKTTMERFVHKTISWIVFIFLSKHKLLLKPNIFIKT